MEEQAKKEWLFFDRFVTREAADKAVSECSTFFLFLAAIHGVLGVFFFGPILLFDVLVYAGGAIWLRRSRSVGAAMVLAIFAVVASVATVANRLGLQTIVGGTNVFLVPVLLVAGGAAVRGALAYNRFAKAEDPSYVPPRKWLSVLAVSLAVVLVLVSFLGLLVNTGVLGAGGGRLVSGTDLDSSVREFLVERELILPDNESVVLYFSGNLLEYQTDGTVLTDRRVLSYGEVDGEFWSDWYGLDEISETEVEDAGGLLDWAVVVIRGPDGSGFSVLLPSDGVSRFLEELEARRGQAQAICSFSEELKRLVPS